MPYKDYEDRLKRSNEYYHKNKKKIADKNRKYYLENREEVLEKQRIKMQKPSNKRKARIWHRLRDRRYRRKTIKIYGGKCVKCGFDDWRAMQVDHIHGEGNKERKKLNQWQYKKMIMAGDKTKFQLLCANCNKIKQYKNKEFGDGGHKNK